MCIGEFLETLSQAMFSRDNLSREMGRRPWNLEHLDPTLWTHPALLGIKGRPTPQYVRGLCRCAGTMLGRFVKAHRLLWQDVQCVKAALLHLDPKVSNTREQGPSAVKLRDRESLPNVSDRAAPDSRCAADVSGCTWHACVWAHGRGARLWWSSARP